MVRQSIMENVADVSEPKVTHQEQKDP